LIDPQAAKATANRDDRSRFVLLQLGVDPLVVSSLFVELVTQLYAVTFNQQEAFQEVVAQLRRGVGWPLAGGKLVYGWPASEGLQKVKITAVPDFVTLDQISAHMATFGHVLKIERGRDKFFPAASDGVVHINIQLRPGSVLPNFLAIREEGRTLLNVAYVFSDLHKKVCFRCGQLAHLGQYCRAAIRAITEQGPAWSFMDVPAQEEGVELEDAIGGFQEAGCRVIAPACCPAARWGCGGGGWWLSWRRPGGGHWWRAGAPLCVTQGKGPWLAQPWVRLGW
jgi:hypothetical protein